MRMGFVSSVCDWVPWEHPGAGYLPNEDSKAQIQSKSLFYINNLFY